MTLARLFNLVKPVISLPVKWEIDTHLYWVVLRRKENMHKSPYIILGIWQVLYWRLLLLLLLMFFLGSLSSKKLLHTEILKKGKMIRLKVEQRD